MGKIKDLPLLERPREKALRYGINTLSNQELIAIVLGSGTRNKSALEIGCDLINEYNGLLNLSRVSQENLMKTKGISDVGSLRILACFELAKNIIKLNQETSKDSSNVIENIIKKYTVLLRKEEQEHMYLICLDKSLNIKKEKHLYVGTSDLTAVNIEEIIAEILITKCRKVILIHNHPNGSSLPSDQDIIFTEKLKNKCKEFRVKIIDHIIISEGGNTSLFHL